MTRAPHVSPLVDVAWLAAHADDPDVVVLEVGDDASGYYSGHLPGAASLGWSDELQEPVRRGFVTATGSRPR